MSRAAVLPWATATLVVVLGGAALTLVVLNGVSVRHMLGEFFVANMSAAFSFGAVGVLITYKRPDLRMGWLCCAVAATTAISPFFANYARYALVTHPGALPAGQAVAWLADWTWPLGYGLFVIGVPLLFPDGRLPLGRWRTVAWAGVAAVVLSMVGSALTPAADPDLPEVANPYGIPGAKEVAQAVFNLGTAVLAIAALAAVASMVARFRRATGRERDQLRWLIFVAALLAATQIGVPLGGSAAGLEDPAILGYVEGIAAPWLAVAIAVAVLRHRLYDIDIWINRTLVYGSMTALVAAVYVLVVGYFGAELDVHGSAAGLVGAAVVAVGFHPVRERVQRAVNRGLYGRRDEPYQALSGLGRRLEASVSPDTVLQIIAGAVREALRVPYVRVDVGGLAHAEAGTPVPPETGERLAVVFGAETVGELLVAPRGPREPLGPADRRLLADFARQIGPAVHAVALDADLRAAHERLIAAREEERGRLHRELHDGLGPHLASQALALDAARALLKADPAEADALLVELRGQVQEAVAGIRNIVNDLRPTALDERGLVGALRQHAQRYSLTDLQVTVTSPAALPDLPDAVELAAYRIATEAITNTARHAQASRCTVTVGPEDDGATLRLVVTDDGCGLVSDCTPGVGVRSMRQRAADLGGSCSVEDAPGGGTRVVANLPLGSGGR